MSTDFLPGSTSGNEDIRYLQSQNGNMYSGDFGVQGAQSMSTSEFEPLRSDVPSDIPFCTEALGRSPDAVNLWIGDGRSVTSIHSDPYENIYTVLRGAKHFTLLPPTEGWCLRERTFPHATYSRCTKTGKLFIEPTVGADEIRWSSVSTPHVPGVLPDEAHPVHITLEQGDTLYLPAGWWHHVRQLNGATTIALNWWYDMEMRGMSWVTLSFLRGIIEVPSENADDANKEIHKILTRFFLPPVFYLLAIMPKDKSEKKDKKRKEAPDAEPVADVEMVDADGPKSKKAKKGKEEIVIPAEDLSPLAHPLAQKKLVKKLHKTIKKASKARQVKRGVKEVVKGIRKGEKGLLILAADINPIDIISHLPVLSEEAHIPYIFVASKEELGHASSTKRPTSCVMVCPDQKRKKRKDGEKEDKDDDYRELYDECYKEVEKLDTQIAF
ncbi:hypothetical protein DXG01_006312 [Tephrocybe rancida]|nr:hypothetical protein DXG01_006312 [Tephrocybe rancida]